MLKLYRLFQPLTRGDNYPPNRAYGRSGGGIAPPPEPRMRQGWWWGGKPTRDIKIAKPPEPRMRQGWQPSCKNNLRNSLPEET